MNAVELFKKTVEHFVFVQILESRQNLCGEVLSFNAGKGECFPELLAQLFNSLLDDSPYRLGQFTLLYFCRQLTRIVPPNYQILYTRIFYQPDKKKGVCAGMFRG